MTKQTQRLTHDELLKLVRKEVVRLGSQHSLAMAAGVTDGYISDILSCRRSLGPALLLYMQYKVEIRYVKQ